MAKKPAKTKKTKKAKATTPATTVDPRVIGERQLQGLFRHSDETKAKTGSLSGTFREALGYAKENQGLNTVAFGIVDRLRRMAEKDGMKARDAWESILYYASVCKLTKRLPGDMLKDAKTRPDKAAPPTSGPGTPTPESDLAKVGRGEQKDETNVTPIREKAVA